MSGEPQQPIVIEFAGLPGVGKTTLTRLLAERLAAEGYRCTIPRFRVSVSSTGRSGRVWRYARRAASYFMHPRLLAATIRFGFAIRPLSLERIKWLREIPDLISSIRTAAAEHELVLLDQAFLQAIWSATLNGSLPPTPLLEELIRSATEACGGRVVYLHLVVDPETALDRIAGRTGGRSRFDRMPREEGVSLLAENKGRLGRIIDCATRANSAVVQELDGQATVPVLGDAIVEFIAARLDPRAVRADPETTGGPEPPLEEPLAEAEPDLGGTAIVSRQRGCSTRNDADNRAELS